MTKFEIKETQTTFIGSLFKRSAFKIE